MNRLLVIVSASLLALAACGDDGAPAGDAAGGCAAMCNALALPTVVTKTANAAARPAFTGGPIVDGTYKVTSVVTYGTATPGGTTVQEVYRFAGNTVESGVASSEMAETHFCGTFTTSANMITFNLTCPATRSITLQYTMAGSTYSFQHGSDQNEVAFATP
jgi:hypothetical protein